MMCSSFSKNPFKLLACSINVLHFLFIVVASYCPPDILSIFLKVPFCWQPFRSFSLHPEWTLTHPWFFKAQPTKIFIMLTHYVEGLGMKLQGKEGKHKKKQDICSRYSPKMSTKHFLLALLMNRCILLPLPLNMNTICGVLWPIKCLGSDVVLVLGLALRRPLASTFLKLSY